MASILLSLVERAEGADGRRRSGIGKATAIALARAIVNAAAVPASDLLDYLVGTAWTAA